MRWWKAHIFRKQLRLMDKKHIWTFLVDWLSRSLLYWIGILQILESTHRRLRGQVETTSRPTGFAKCMAGSWLDIKDKTDRLKQWNCLARCQRRLSHLSKTNSSRWNGTGWWIYVDFGLTHRIIRESLKQCWLTSNYDLRTLLDSFRIILCDVEITILGKTTWNALGQFEAPQVEENQSERRPLGINDAYKGNVGV